MGAFSRGLAAIAWRALSPTLDPQRSGFWATEQWACYAPCRFSESTSGLHLRRALRIDRHVQPRTGQNGRTDLEDPP
jgi:hypothetical protein